MLDNKTLQIAEKGLPFWNDLTDEQKRLIADLAVTESFKQGDTIHRSDDECRGVLFIVSGQLRAYILSEDGREVTLYRLYSNDVCILSASCALDAVAFDVFIEASENSRAIIIPLAVFRRIMNENIRIELFTYKESTERFSDVMWTLQQILFMSADRRIAHFLWDEAVKTGSDTLNFTHDRIARYIGSAREVVTRMLKYFSDEGIVRLSRGKIQILDRKKLSAYL